MMMMFRSSIPRLCSVTSSSSGSGISGSASQHLSTAISKDINPYAQSCIKVPTSILRIKNKLAIPTGERQPVGLQPLPPPGTPSAPPADASLSLRAAMQELEGDAERASSLPLSRLWTNAKTTSTTASSSSSVTSTNNDVELLEAVAARQQMLDVDSVTPPEDGVDSNSNSSSSSSSSSNKSSSGGASFNSVSRCCVCKATFLGTVVFAEKLAETPGAVEIVLLCDQEEEEEQGGGGGDSKRSSGVLVCIHVDKKHASKPALTATGGLKVGSRCLVSGSLRMQRTVQHTSSSPSSSSSAASSTSQNIILQHHTLPVLDKITSIHCVKAAGSDGEQVARELLQRTEIC